MIKNVVPLQHIIGDVSYYPSIYQGINEKFLNQVMIGDLHDLTEYHDRIELEILVS